MDNFPFAFEYIEQASGCGSVPGFVRQNTNLVVRSPKGTDFNGLDGIWKSGFALYCGLLGFALARVMMWEAPVRFRPRQSDDVGSSSQINIDTPDWNSIIEMKCEERIKVKRRINTYFINKLKGINAVQKGPSPYIVDYDELVSKSIALDGLNHLRNQCLILVHQTPMSTIIGSNLDIVFSRALQEFIGLGGHKVIDGKSADLLAWIEKTGEDRNEGLFKFSNLIGYDGVYIYDEYGNLNIASRLNLISDMKAGIIRLLEFM
ncbi:18734_t:CDS:10, partial [Acaulospora morrowiae]